jgi:transposase
MSIQRHQPNEIPEETRRVAHLAFPQGNPCMGMREEPGTFYTDERFTDLFAVGSQPAEAPAPLALVTIMQFTEGLFDRQAGHAVRRLIHCNSMSSVG